MPKRSLKEFTKVGDLLVDLNFYESKLETQSNGCIHFVGAKHPQGYGMIGAVRIKDNKDIMATAHRVAMRIKTGLPLDPKECVMHQVACHPSCVNPDHLTIGTLYDRNRLMREKGTQSCGKTGPRPRVPAKQNRKYKYTDEEIKWIRTASTADIAVKYNTNKTIASRIKWTFVNGYKWLK